MDTLTVRRILIYTHFIQRPDLYIIDCSHDGAGGHPIVHDLVHEEGGLHRDDPLARHVLRLAVPSPPPLQHVVKILKIVCGFRISITVGVFRFP